MTHDEHRERHVLLHRMFDELLGDFISHTDKLPSQTNLLELAAWSHQQTLDPTEGARKTRRDAGLSEAD